MIILVRCMFHHCVIVIYMRGMASPITQMPMTFGKFSMFTLRNCGLHTHEIQNYCNCIIVCDVQIYT